MITNLSTPPSLVRLISSKQVLAAALLMLSLAGCSKDDTSGGTGLAAKSSADSEAPSYYAITDTEGIALAPDGIAYKYLASDHIRWQLSYREIAERLGIDISQISSLKITRDCVLENGLWRFNVRFSGQQEGSSFAIDVDSENGAIKWVVTMEDMPGEGMFTIRFGC